MAIRILYTLLVLLCFNINLSAQSKQYNKKEFDKLKTLAEEWKTTSSINIYEEWKVENDTIIIGLRYKVEDTNYIPAAEMTIIFSKHNIKMKYRFIYENNTFGREYLLDLINIKNEEYYFYNVLDDNLSQEEKNSLNENLIGRMYFDFKKKKCCKSYSNMSRSKTWHNH